MINQDIKQAMRDKAEVALVTLRMLNASLKNKAIAMRDGADVVLTEEMIVETIASEVKKRQDAIESFLVGNRADLADKEKAEIEILKKYLPAQATDEELVDAIRALVAAGTTDFGRVMGQTMAQFKGKVDGKRLGELVKQELAK